MNYRGARKLRQNKRQNPDYENLSGYIPTDITQLFKERCQQRRITQNDGLELSVNSWLKVEKFFKLLEKGERPCVDLIAEIAHDLALSAGSLTAIVNTVLLHRKNGEIEPDRNGN